LYAGKVAEPLEDVVKLARELEKALAVLIDERNVDAWGANPWLDAELRRAIYLRTGQIEEGDCIELYRRHVSSLADAAGQAVAKVRAEMQERGPQPGMKHARQNYDPQLCHFVTRIAFDALRAGARATGDEAGTLIPLLEELRAYLPPEFLPPIDDHPCRSYQRMIERAREAWTKSAPQIPGQTQH
jgi:hypothetical protein